MWSDYGSCRYYASIEAVPLDSRTPNAPYKIALFDLDGTLITSSNGKRYADTDPSAWVYLGQVPEKLQQLRVDGWIVAILTNQSRFNSNVGNRIENVRLDLQSRNGWSPLIFIATSNDIFRKPQAGMLSLLLGLLQSPPHHLERIFMCGDGVGSSDPYPPYQWSSADSDLALSMGLVFHRPMDVFGTNFGQTRPREDGATEMVILVGNPGSGKSTTAALLSANGYASCSGDILKSVPRLNGCVVQNLKAGRSVVIDCTNPSREKRASYVKLASEHGAQVRMLWHVRDGRSWNQLRSKPVPDVAYGVYSKHFDRPAASEAPLETIY